MIKSRYNDIMEAWASAEGGWGACSPWIFIHDTDKVEVDLMVLFFVLVFFLLAPTLEIFLSTLLNEIAAETNNYIYTPGPQLENIPWRGKII